MNKRELKRPETVEMEAIGSFHLAGSWQSSVLSVAFRLPQGAVRGWRSCEFAPCSKSKIGFTCVIHPAGPELRHHSVGGRRGRGRGTSCVLAKLWYFSYRPVLKHGPRSLTYMRLCWCFKPNMSNESERCQSQDAASANCNPLEKRIGYEHIC